ncbi:hypothetical protein [Rheinheimera sp.]|uniref:hypothetical protein n=1 Tax=Rheinheimera sp. TaxID=1869214 RepID=UPI002732F260|nr:hypothetical protein [Rheinheimera sp.]MDP2714892.1 hypothetical protein [Rheinheimera sp.]
MNTLTALTFTACVTAGLYSTVAGADELTEQVRAAVPSSQTELRVTTAQQAQLAMHKTVIELLARHSAQQDAQALQLAYQAPHSIRGEAE